MHVSPRHHRGDNRGLARLAGQQMSRRVGITLFVAFLGSALAVRAARADAVLGIVAILGFAWFLNSIWREDE